MKSRCSSFFGCKAYKALNEKKIKNVVGLKHSKLCPQNGKRGGGVKGN